MDILNFLESLRWGVILNIVFTVLFLIVALRLVKTFMFRLFERIKKRARDPESTKNFDTLRVILIHGINFIIFIFAVINILNLLGVDVRPIITAAGVVGVAVGFGSKRFVEDLISGLIILFEGQIRVGDVVEIQNVTGTVEKMTLSIIVLRSIDGAAHFIRNGMVDMVTNYTRGFSYSLVEISVAYKEDIAHVIDVIKKIGEDLRYEEEYRDKITGEIEVLGLDKFNDSSITILARFRTLPRYQWDIKRAFNLRIKEKFDELGIEIPFNQLVITENKN